MALTFVLPTLFGLEGVAAAEARRLGLREVRGEDGRVLCQGELADLPRLNLQLRTAERVILLLGRFPAATTEEFFQGVGGLPWEDYIPRDGRFPVRCQCVDSALHAELTFEKMAKKAIAQRLSGRYGLSALPETGALYQVRCLIFKDVVTIGLDSSGPALHKRGYRARSVEAPLRETLAAGLVLLSRYRGKGLFVDPFCGSGTIAIEAALIAKNRAPGLDRAFSAQKWAVLPQEAWLDAAQEALDGEYGGDYQILASDLDPAAVALARENAALAGVEELIRFETADALAFSSDAPGGRMVTNPPYGERLMDRQSVEALYRGLGQTLRRLPAGWEAWILSAHPEFETALGMTAQRRRRLYNGKLRCNLFLYQK